MFETWAKSDPDAAFAYTREHPGRGELDNRSYTVVQAVLTQDPGRGIGIIARHPDAIHTSGSLDWAKKDPERAVRLIAGLPNCFFRDNELRDVVSMWAEKDPRGALAWINSLGNADEHRDYRRNTYDSIARTDLALAKQMFNDPAQAEDVRKRLGQGIVSSMARSDPDAALEWISHSLDGAAQTEALQDIVASMSYKSPTRAAELFASLPAGSRKYALEPVARSWSWQDPEAALEWSLSLEDPAEQKVALASIGRTVRSPGDLVALLNEHPDNAAMTVMMKELARGNPGSDGMRWAEQLPTTHGQWLARELFTKWARTSPESAMEYLNGPEIPAELRASSLAGFARTYFHDAPEAATAWASEVIKNSPTARQDQTAIRRAVRIADMPNTARTEALQALQDRTPDQ
jgi:hypothetical protein